MKVKVNGSFYFQEGDKEDNLISLNRYFSKFNSFILKKTSENAGATEVGKENIGNKFILKNFNHALGIEGEVVFYLENELIWIRSSPIKTVEFVDESKIVFETLNSTYELDMV